MDYFNYLINRIRHKTKGFSGGSTSFKEYKHLSQKVEEEETLKDSCSILLLLPEKYEIEKDTLIQLWMAGDYIQDYEPVELTGEECFSFAVKNGYLSPSGTNSMTGKDRYRVNIKKIHTLLQDKKYGGKAIAYLKWDNQHQENSMPAAKSIQHVSLACSDIDKTILQTLKKMNNLRTLLFLATHRVQHIPDHLFSSFSKLQALDLSRTQIRELPSSVGHMVHLRYLDLSWTLIKWLPDIICSLVKLLTLKLRGCSNLSVLPEQLNRLTKLRHLEVDVLRQLETMPKGIGALVHLRTLSAFVVDTEDGCKIQELKELNNLSGKLCIARLENVEDANEAKEAALYRKEQLEKVELRWTASEICGTHHNSDAILKRLQPCKKSLEELQILCYEGATFPSWIGDPEFNKLASIVFYRCENLLELPLIEQLPHLKHLELVRMNSVKRIGCHRGEQDVVAFPKLEKLEINEMQSLRVWVWRKTNEGDFMRLTQLIIDDCPELEEFDVLPHLSSIQHFEIRECPKLKSRSDMKIPDFLEQEGVDCYKLKRAPRESIQEVNEDE